MRPLSRHHLPQPDRCEARIGQRRLERHLLHSSSRLRLTKSTRHCFAQPACFCYPTLSQPGGLAHTTRPADMLLLRSYRPHFVPLPCLVQLCSVASPSTLSPTCLEFTLVTANSRKCQTTPRALDPAATLRRNALGKLHHFVCCQALQEMFWFW